MDRREANGWMIYSWGEALKVAITPSPWEAELAVTLLAPALSEDRGICATAFLPTDPEIKMETLQEAFQLTARRAESLHQAFLDALEAFSSESEAAEEMPPARPLIPIFPVKG